MRHITAAFMVILISILVFINVRQAYLYQEELSVIEELEKQQQIKFEENRKIRTGIAILESPQRLDSLSEQELGLDKARPDQTVLIISPGRVE